MSPTIVLRGKRPVLALGSPGGSSIITTVLQILVNRFEREMSLPDAIADPRVSERNSAASEAEVRFISSPVGKALIDAGHQLKAIEELGAATGIDFKRRGRMEAAAEPVRRGGGSAMVVTPSP
jgi:gamma-glutamyltranspeptidase/glutathione hydrolase